MRKFSQINEGYSDTITLTIDELQEFARNEKHPKYPDLEWESDTDDGDSIRLYNSKTHEIWETTGGYFTGPAGIVLADRKGEIFNQPLTFTKVKSKNMIVANSGKWGKYIEATICIKVKRYLGDQDNRTEISLEEAKGLIMRELDSLASSNDGSELLANISEDQINFE